MAGESAAKKGQKTFGSNEKKNSFKKLLRKYLAIITIQGLSHRKYDDGHYPVKQHIKEGGIWKN